MRIDYLARGKLLVAVCLLASFGADASSPYNWIEVRDGSYLRSASTTFPRAYKDSNSSIICSNYTFGAAQSYAIIAGSTVTNSGASNVYGSLATSSSSAIGFSTDVVHGEIHTGDDAALNAQADASTVYRYLAGLNCTNVMTGIDLGGVTVNPGVNCFVTTAQLTGTVTMNGTGDPEDVFIFQIGTTLTTSNNAAVLLINGAKSTNVFWQVGSSATIGVGAEMAGNILAYSSISLNTGATLAGRAFCQVGGVTMLTNTITPEDIAVISCNDDLTASGHSIFNSQVSVLLLSQLFFYLMLL